MERLILAHDLGTSGNKATLFGEDGRLVGSRTHPYDTVYRPGGVAEQNPEDWWTAVCESTRALLAEHDGSGVAAIAFSGTMMGCLCVDRLGRPLRPHLLYCDQRANRQADRLEERATPEKVYRISGHPVNAVNSGPKYMWIKEHEPDIYRETHKILNAKDYLNFRLTGRLATDPSDASGTNLYDLEKWAWSDELVADAGLDMEKLPDIVPSAGIVGELTTAAATALGLRAGIPVMAGAGDGSCAGVGAGSVAPGMAYACVGSSAWVGMTTDRPLLDAGRRTVTFAHAVPGMFQPMGTMLMGGSAYAWAAAALGQKDLAKAMGVSWHELMNQAAAASPTGARGLVFLPHLMGERSPRWNSLARGGFVGLGVSHGAGDMARAVMEGVALNLAASVDIFRGLGQDVREVTMIGGAATALLWRRIMADAFGATILRPNFLEEATSTGAAVIAGVGAGIFPDFSVIDRFLRIEDRVEPIPEHVAVYAARKILFDQVYRALEPLFPRFAALS